MSEDRGIYLGRGRDGDVFSGSERSTLVLGPSRSGKTSSLVIPNLLTTSRSALVTSTKDDVVAIMAGARGDGATLLFDPSGTIRTPPGVQRVGYSPVHQALNWDGAVLATRSLVDVAHRGRADRADDHWSERAGALLAPLLHAAALRGESLGQLASRVDQRSAHDAHELLNDRYGDWHPSVSLLAGVLATDERERSGIWSTASGLLAGVRTDAAREASRTAPLDVEEFLRGPHQLHVVAPSRHQALSIPLVVGLVEHVIHATYERHDDGARLLLALDEVANVAPLPRLAGVVSEGGGQGVVTMACLQDLSQARARWGVAADGFVSLFATTVMLPGVADRATLELLHHLAGRTMTPNRSHQRRAWGRPGSTTTSWIERDRASVANLARGRAGYALGLAADKSMNWIELTPAHRDARFSRYLTRPDVSRESRSR